MSIDIDHTIDTITTTSNDLTLPAVTVPANSSGNISRWVMDTVSGTSSNAGYWCKLITLDPTVDQYSYIKLRLSINDGNAFPTYESNAEIIIDVATDVSGLLVSSSSIEVLSASGAGSLTGTSFQIVRPTDAQWEDMINNHGTRQRDLSQTSSVVIIPYAAPPKPTTQYDYEVAIQNKLDIAAKDMGYDNIMSACSYAGYPNSFQNEAIAFGQWRSAVWEYSYAQLNLVMAGSRTQPTVNEFLLEIDANCVLTLPV